MCHSVYTHHELLTLVSCSLGTTSRARGGVEIVWIRLRSRCTLHYSTVDCERGLLPGKRQAQYSSCGVPVFWMWHPTNRNDCGPAA
jgi:hypothetical protein